MSFTQEKKTNILHCNGCKKHCSLGFRLAEEEYYFPTIGGVVINSFLDENDNIRTTVKTKSTLSKKGIEHPYDQTVYMLNMAREIARLCDNYKQR